MLKLKKNQFFAFILWINIGNFICKMLYAIESTNRNIKNDLKGKQLSMPIFLQINLKLKKR